MVNAEITITTHEVNSLALLCNQKAEATGREYALKANRPYAEMLQNPDFTVYLQKTASTLFFEGLQAFVKEHGARADP